MPPHPTTLQKATWRRSTTWGGRAEVFTGEEIHLRCVAPADFSVWKYVWLRDDVELPEVSAGSELRVSPAESKHSGGYSCRRERKTVAGKTVTPKSMSLHITVNVGYVMLLINKPLLVGDTLQADCLVRGDPIIDQVSLYKDDVLVTQQERGTNGTLYVPRVDLSHRGSYTCSAAWRERGRPTNAKSKATAVNIQEIVAEPRLLVKVDDPPATITLSCVFDFYGRQETPVHVHFYRDGRKLLGIARSYSQMTLKIQNRSGSYSCKARVPKLDLARSSPHFKYDKH
ncbi:Fc receptor-like protein 4 [Merluccius polli]|uniref:Fc receptor-like protein 4 n=1 Tax=Merluccius polli TaxID=89951 RepID=A0AA47N149_MERPO|nr:Fc receptor-like protein 4 [Merluccius polli]